MLAMLEGAFGTLCAWLRVAPGALLTSAARDGPRTRGDGQTDASGGAPDTGWGEPRLCSLREIALLDLCSSSDSEPWSCAETHWTGQIMR